MRYLDIGLTAAAVACVAGAAEAQSATCTGVRSVANGVTVYWQTDQYGYPCVDSSAGGGGGGGAVTAAIGAYVDGSIVTLGTEADTAYTGTGNATHTAILKGIYNALVAPLPAGANALGSVSVTGTPTVSIGSGGSVTLLGTSAVSISGTPTVSITGTNAPVIAAGTNTIGGVNIVASTSNGYSEASYINSATGTFTGVPKAGGGNIGAFSVSNTGTAGAFFRFFNLATAPTIGSSTPSWREYVPAGATIYHDEPPPGGAQTTGIAFDVTSGSMADSDTGTFATANIITVNVLYK